jgi:hypothetical protein
MLASSSAPARREPGGDVDERSDRAHQHAGGAQRRALVDPLGRQSEPRWRDRHDGPGPAADRELEREARPGEHGAATPHGAGAFTYEPAGATPTVGGRLLSAAAGFRYDSDVGSRRDVVGLRR